MLMVRPHRIRARGITAPLQANCSQLILPWPGSARRLALVLLGVIASTEVDAQASGTPLPTQAEQRRVVAEDDGVRLLDPRPLTTDRLADALPRRPRQDGRDSAVARAPRGETPPAITGRNAARRNDPQQSPRHNAQATTTPQRQTSQAAGDAPSQAPFDLRRLTASVLFDARPNARVFTGNFGLTYAVTDSYQLGLLLPVAYVGAFGNKLMANNVTLRNTFLRTLDSGSFIGVTADATFGDGAVFQRPNSFLTVSPFLSLRLLDHYDLFLSASWGASVAATGRISRALNDEWSVGLEYSRTAGVAGQLLPARDQPQTLLAIAELNREGRQFSFGVGPSFANGSTGLAARFGVMQSFR